MSAPQLFSREEIKATLMQASYSQQEKGSKAQLEEDLESEYTDDVYDAFVQAVQEIVPGFYTVMEFTNSLWNKDWIEVSWKLPDDVIVTCKPTTSRWEEFRLFDQITVQAKVSGVKKEKQSLMLYVNIIHSIDAYIARQLVLRADYDMITIHDGFKVHANDAKRTRELYNEVLHEIASTNLLESILEQITGQSVTPIQGDLNLDSIKSALYSLS